ELLEIRYVSDHVVISTFWYTTQKRRIIPTSMIQRVVMTAREGVFETTWDYALKRHPVLRTMHHGVEVETPTVIAKDSYRILGRPTRLFFQLENLLYYERRDIAIPYHRPFKFSTRKARTALWKVWFSTDQVDGVYARMLDEHLLRQEPLLRPYWRHRDAGRIKAAIRHLEKHEDQIAAAIYIDDDISSKSHVAFKLADLYMMGMGGDSYVTSLRPQITFPITPEKLHVLGLDTGTWPSSSGGVSNYMVDNLASIRWNILAENAHDMELILSQFQIEYNVNTVCMLPLWGYDWLDACHGLMGAKTDLEMEDKETRSDDRAVTNMIDILRRLIHYCHIRDLRATDLEAASRVFVDYYDFFQIYDYNAIWNHPRVRLAWMEMWMDRMPDNLLDLEAATVTSLLNTMDYMRRCMCCLAVTLPDDPPDVVQASHHATGSIVGLVLKLKKGVALHVWDHGILWREYLGHWSGAESKYRPSLHNMMIMMVRLIASLSLYNADVILPCTSISNPEWEVIRGSNNGTIDHRNQTLRRIDPMTNGISDMTDFEPDFTAELPDPTAVMLSHIVTFKDIKNAVLAADVIVNQFGIKRYFLDIYGSTDKLPWYTYECQTLITTLGLQDNVKIRGFGDSKYVLNSAWLVLNSSISEGLPLALGEAGLSGQPIVCTEAGGSREIIQGPGNHLYGRNVSPGSPYELALGQLAVLGLFDGLEDVANGRDPDPNADKLVDWISARRFADISERIMAKRLERRKLGLALRAHVLKKFSGTRYLREHEQMLWIG
ncbi:hypothetical protein CXG81DRAFT_7368, partial [Caulochytrium protostelioides]